MYLIAEADIAKLSTVLMKQYKNVILKDDFGWKSPPLDVLDAVLSLNRRYEGFVLPRLYSFKNRHTEIKQLSELKDLIYKYPSPLLFSVQELNYRDERRAETILGVVNYCLQVQSHFHGNTELERLQQWAITAKPSDAYSVGVKGFGIAGFQYLRMLWGAQITKPDVHIVDFISEVIGKTLDQETAILILEKAAKNVGLPIRQIDSTIWKERSNYRYLYD